MNFCIVQHHPVTGDVETNILNHIKFIKLANTHQADLIMFPELSLTGYEPELADRLATSKDDTRFDVFQNLSDQFNMIIAVGMPLKIKNGIIIGMIIFEPGKQRSVNGKKYLHNDELPFFVNGNHLSYLLCSKNNIGLSICYEISIEAHTEWLINHGATIYLASVAKFQSGVDDAKKTLSSTAKKYSISVLMANATGPVDNGICAGQSAVWDRNGKILDQLNQTREGILIYSTDTQKTDKIYL